MRIVFTVILSSLLLGAQSLIAQNERAAQRAQEVLTHLSEPDHDGFSMLPSSSELLEVQINNENLLIQLRIPPNFLLTEFNDEIHEEVVEHFASSFADFSFQQINLEARNATGNFQALSDFLSKHSWGPMDLASNDDPLPYQQGFYNRKGNPLKNEVQASGMLNDKTVWLSAGHGWKYDSRRKVFKTQRHNSHGLVEDFTTIEGVNYHLLKYLYQAGANVWTVRERDMNTQEVIVDNDQKAPYYKESGAWSKSTTNGLNGKSYRYAISAKKATAAAHFTPDIPESGMYWVSVYYVNGGNRSVDTRYKIVHAGGESMVSINQEVHGKTWVYLGQFYFEKGKQGKVVLINESSETGQAVIADAVRFGGGLGTTPDCDSGRKSGEPRFEEAARYYAKFQGFPYCLNDVMVRPHYAEWELAKGTRQEQQNSVYISWHTNASPNHQSGSESYIHSRRPVRGSKQLRDYIHQEMITDIRHAWQRNWSDRGAKSADFGELRGLQTMPGVLLEIAFHDHAGDANALSTPAFRNLVARSVYKGIVRYYAAKDHRPPVFLPEAPSHVSAVNQGRNEIRLDWKKPIFGGVFGDAAQDYKIYYSLHPKAFAESVESKNTTFTFSKLKPATTYYFKVVARNQGGESFASPVIAARTPNGKRLAQAKYLIVDGFDRLDKGLAIKVKEKKPHYAPLGNTRRLFLEQMNNFDYAGEHAQALALSGVYFDGAVNEALGEGSLLLNHYDGVDWYLGRESTADQVLSSKEIALLKNYLDGGGNLIISGSELAFALDHKNQGKSFYQNYLKSAYRGDDAGQAYFSGSGAFAPLNGQFGNSAYGGYPAKSLDYVTARAGGVPVLKYKNGQIAAVAYKGDFGMVNFAFPLENIGDLKTRSALLQKAIDYLGDKTSKEALVLAEMPSMFSDVLKVNLERSPEGFAIFELFNPEGEEVMASSWNHNGSGTKVFATHRLPPALYQYRFELMGLEQKGFILKE